MPGVEIGTSPDESRLIAAARRGDLDARRQLVREHQRAALRAAFLITGSTADAEEVAQDAFVKALDNLRRFRHGAPFKPWLLTIVMNEARNRRRASGARMTFPLDDVVPDRLPSPELLALASDRRREIGRALRSLATDDRDVLICRFFLDLSERETADVLGIRLGTVKSRTSRALLRLRAELEEAA